jgi:aspartate/methionine/tyrosine aminotransferase
MHWAKTRSRARFNLATSGVANVSMNELAVTIGDLEITRDGGYGYEPLQKALSERYSVNIDSIASATGTSLANHLAMACVVKPGDEVLLERPAYEPLLALANYLGAEVKRFDRKFEDGFQVMPEEIEKNVTPRTKLIVITNLHNPSGVLSNETTLMRVGEIAKSVNAHVLVDEVYVEALFEQRPRTAFHLGNEFVVTSSLTKVFGLSGLRCGWIIAEPAIVRNIWRLNDLFGAMPAHPAERLSFLALQQLDRFTARARSLLDQNRRYVSKFLDSQNQLEVVKPPFGTIVFPRVKQGSADTLCDLLREKYETSVVPGRFFEMPAHFRLGIGGDPQILQSGLERLWEALDEWAE